MFYDKLTQDRSSCANFCQEGVLALTVNDRQQGTIYIFVTVTCDTLNTDMKRQTTGMLYLLLDKICIKHITRIEWVKMQALHK